MSPGGKLPLESDIGSIEGRGSGTNKVDIEVVREVRTGREREADRILKEIDFFKHGMIPKQGFINEKRMPDFRGGWAGRASLSV